MISARHALVSGLLFGLLLLVVPAGHGQDTDPGGDPAGGNAGGNTGENTGGTAGAPTAPQEDADTDDSPLERLIYVPYRKLRDVFDNQGASVVMPYAEYLKMLERVMEPGAGRAPEAVITQAAYVAKAQGDLARIDVDLTVLVMGDAWVRVPVAFGDAAIGSVSGDKGQVLLQGTGNGTYALLFEQSGEQHVRLQLFSRIRTSPEGRRLELKTPRVGITSLDLTVPSADQAISITPQQVLQPVDQVEGQTRIRTNLGATDQIVAQWTPRASSRPQMDLLTSVTNNLSIQIDEGLIHRTSNMTFNVLRGEMNELSFVLPADDRLLDVVSPGNQIRRWSSEKQDKQQVVTVQLLAATEDNVVLEVHSERSLPDGEFRVGGIAEDGTVHGIHATGVVRESGQLSVSANPALAVTVARQQGVTRTSQAAGKFGWKFYGSGMDVSVSADPIQPRILVVQTSAFSVDADNELRLTAGLNYHVERAGVFELQLQVPDGLTIDAVRGDRVADFSVSDGRLRIELAGLTIGSFQIAVDAHRDFAAAATAETALPVLSAEGVERESGRVTVSAPPAVEIVTRDEAVKGLFPADSGPAVARGTMRLVSSWTYNRAPIEIAVTTSRKPTRLTAAVDTLIDVRPRIVTVNTKLNFQVANAGVDTFRFAVREEVADSVRITSPSAIKQQTRADQAEDGWVTWTVVMQQRVQGDLTLNVAWDVTAGDEAAEDEAMDVTVEPARIGSAGQDGDIEAIEVKGEVAIGKDQSLSVTAETGGDDIEAIDVRELTRMSSDHSLAYRYFRQDASLSVSALKYEIQEVVETVVSRAAVEVALTHDRMATFLCRYRINSSERQRLRIDLPADAELLDQLVNGTRISLTPAEEQAEEGWDAFYANYGTAVGGSAATEAFLLTLHFRKAIVSADSEPFEGLGGRQKLRLPRIGGTSASVVVQQLRTAIWLPPDYALVGQPKRFVREQSSTLEGIWPLRVRRPSGQKDLDQWIGGGATGMVDFPREGHSYTYSSLGSASEITVRWWEMPRRVWIISGTVLLIGFVLRRTPWENRLTVVLLAAFAAVLYALDDSETVVQATAAASWGIVAVVALWVIYDLIGRRDAVPAAGGNPPPLPPSDAPPGGDSAPPEPKKPAPQASSAAVVPPPGSFDSVDKLMGRKSQ